jgi:hypothetical protein
VLTPTSIAMFPGKALVFRRGLVRETAPQSTVTVNVRDMMGLAGNGFTDPSAGDANRAGEGRDTSRQGLGMEHFAYGKVAADFSDREPSAVKRPDPATFHDAEKGELVGANGEIRWLYKRGVFTVCAPQTQAVSGYLGRAGRVELPDLAVESAMPFGVVWAVAMDGRPLAESRKILLQVMSQEQNYGFRAEGDVRRRVLDMGQAPIQIRNLEGVVRFARPDAARLRVTALDINGCPEGAAGTAEALTLRPATLYYLIE